MHAMRTVQLTPSTVPEWVLSPTYPRRPAPAPAPTTKRTELPRGGTTILGSRRVVAYYGGPNGPALGALGDGTPEQMARVIEHRAAQYARPGRPVLPAIELIATVAQGSPGRDGLYSRAVPRAAIERYLAVAHRHHMLLILDFQPGRSSFLPQVQALADVLSDPSVSLALDPEWKMGPGQRPGVTIGSASAAGIDAVVRYVAELIASRHLPDKLLLVHQFSRAMLPDRQRIHGARGVEVVFHADGFGTRAEKLSTWHRLAFPGRPDGTGFKLFLRQDTAMMTPRQVLALRPAPDVITYQ
ncbi:MAG: hypothetical protein QOG80_2931 [Pseudonocardiales bacterium]|nr:hypothetical protein [Pseudonocardiales bacterium]